MKAKELKEILSFIDDEEEVYINVGGRKLELASFRYDKDVCFTSHNYAMDDNLITISELAHYINEKNKKNENKV